jgi:uncharacterized protein YbjQ (UPF0145 family)
MKTCPNCKEILGDSVKECFNCRYSFIYNRVITQEEIRIKRMEQEKRIEEINLNAEEERIRIEELKLKVKESQRDLQNKRSLTTGYNFEGYKIIEYLGLISGESALGTGFLSEYKASLADVFGTMTNAFSDKLKIAKNAAIDTLIESCIEKGGNAVIGVNYDYITFTNNIIGVIANGTAVIIEKE